MRLTPLLLLVATLWWNAGAVWAADPLRILFLGDNGHHRPEERFLQLEPVLKLRGVELTYVGDVAQALTPETLAQYDGLLLYANIDRIEPAQADALLAYVAGGKGFIPLHCATYCFRNDERIVALMGGQFKRHEGEVFSTVITEPSHPIMQGFGGFSSWDETYVHTKHNTRTAPSSNTAYRGRKTPVTIASRGPGFARTAGADLLHRLGARRADVGARRLPESRRARHPLGVRG